MSCAVAPTGQQQAGYNTREGRGWNACCIARIFLSRRKGERAAAAVLSAHASPLLSRTNLMMHPITQRSLLLQVRHNKLHVQLPHGSRKSGRPHALPAASTVTGAAADQATFSNDAFLTSRVYTPECYVGPLTVAELPGVLPHAVTARS